MRLSLPDRGAALKVPYRVKFSLPVSSDNNLELGFHHSFSQNKSNIVQLQLVSVEGSGDRAILVKYDTDIFLPDEI